MLFLTGVFNIDFGLNNNKKSVHLIEERLCNAITREEGLGKIDKATVKYESFFQNKVVLLITYYKVNVINSLSYSNSNLSNEKQVDLSLDCAYAHSFQV